MHPEDPTSYTNMLSTESFHILSLLITFIGLLYFIITLTKHYMDYRLKSKMIEKNLDTHLMHMLLQPEETKKVNGTMKWVALFAGLGVGLLGISLIQPVGIHSLAILSFCLSLSFLGYHLYIKKHTNN